MSQQIYRLIASFTVFVFVLTLVPRASALVVVDTDFTGNSGAAPAGWTVLGLDSFPESDAVESGTVVTITDGRSGGGPELMQLDNTFTLTPNVSAQLDIGIADMETSPQLAQAQLILGSFSSYALSVTLDPATSAFAAFLFNQGAPAGSLTIPSTPHVPTYAGGTININILYEATSFRITTDVDSFDSGQISYASFGDSGFNNLSDITGNATLLIGTESATGANGDLATIDYDSTRLEIIPEPASLILLGLGSAVMLGRRRR